MARGANRFFNSVGNELKKSSTKQMIGTILAGAAQGATGAMVGGGLGRALMRGGNNLVQKASRPGNYGIRGGKIGKGATKFFNGVGNQLKKKGTQQFLGQLASNVATAAGYGSLVQGLNLGAPAVDPNAQSVPNYSNYVPDYRQYAQSAYDQYAAAPVRHFQQAVSHGQTAFNAMDPFGSVDSGASMDVTGGGIRRRSHGIRALKGRGFGNDVRSHIRSTLREMGTGISLSGPEMLMGTDALSGAFLRRDHKIHYGRGFGPIGSGFKYD
jgi:hypothetical protein